jgi:hypothetical protein
MLRQRRGHFVSCLVPKKFFDVSGANFLVLRCQDGIQVEEGSFFSEAISVAHSA